MFLLGYDIGSSSIKVALVEAQSKKTLSILSYPDTEMQISAPQPGWAEQDPLLWWEHLCAATKAILNKSGVSSADIKGLGISYQMHGLVLVDEHLEVLRPSIIWCDSRAVGIGEDAFQEIGTEKCLQHLLNGPGNFTASKLKWVKDHEPDLYERVYKLLLPGDYIALKLTGTLGTTICGLSEGMFWDFESHGVANFLMEYFGFDDEVLPALLPTFGAQGLLTDEAAEQTGLAKGTPVCYRAGDQPNNALSLNVLKAGEVAATGGTSGVVYGVTDQLVYDAQNRVNSFAHVNHEAGKNSIGVLLCINGAGSQYRYLKQLLSGDDISYPQLEQFAQSVPAHADGLRIVPFGNGAERMLGNKDIGAHFVNVQLNRHQKAHFYRAALEGIAFSFVYGMEVLLELGLNIHTLKVGNDNLFQSSIFSSVIADSLNCEIQMMETTGAVGAALAAGIGAGIYENLDQALGEPQILRTYTSTGTYENRIGYDLWKKDLDRVLMDQ